MIVMKFGGTSVEDAAAIRRVIDIVRREIPHTPLVTVSACAGATNDLINAAHAVRDGRLETAMNVLTTLRERHVTIAHELLSADEYNRVAAALDGMFTELQNYIQGVFLLGELTNRSLDTFSSYGERLSSIIIHAAMQEMGMPSELVDARKVMITDAHFGSAQPLWEVVAERAKQFFLPILEAKKIVVTQGFIGATEDGITTTIGRGGSDLSAAIFGSALRAEEIQIWTDVDGMMTADPHIIPESKLIDIMSFNEASELAYFGAKVLHPRTILPAIEKNIPVRVLNSHRPEVGGTLIVKSPESSSGANGDVIKSIAFKKGITVINVSSSRMLMAHGFLARLFSIFADHEKSIDVVATSEVSVSLTVDNETGLAEIVKELETIGEIRLHRGKAIICIVGEGMKHTPGIAGRIFGALARANVNIEMVSEGASEINLTLVVDENDVNTSVRVLHDEFFG
ncbi:MAG: lysine-sensitive aspartokinase 3 [Ignavibacteriae bacterium]|nr:lysine-sensitive aspartokinase 3 [Ignavibacteria bacterium]MBI3365479.1 lysine-sensitive aspartokinase 3 [Ignavibacteriota bacterium]